MTDEQFDNLLNAIIKAFPREGELLDEAMKRNGYDRQDYFRWLSHFAEITRYHLRSNFRKKRETDARAILEFMSNQFEQVSVFVKGAIIVIYLNELDIGLSQEEKDWVLSFLPENLRHANRAAMR